MCYRSFLSHGFLDGQIEGLNIKKDPHKTFLLILSKSDQSPHVFDPCDNWHRAQSSATVPASFSPQYYRRAMESHRPAPDSSPPHPYQIDIEQDIGGILHHIHF